MEFELVHYCVADQHVNHYITRKPLSVVHETLENELVSLLSAENLTKATTLIKSNRCLTVTMNVDELILKTRFSIRVANLKTFSYTLWSRFVPKEYFRVTTATFTLLIRVHGNISRFQKSKSSFVLTIWEILRTC